MEPEIYLKLRSYNPFRCQYLYFDIDNHLADDIFINNKIRNIKFKNEYGGLPDYPKCRAIICSFYRWDRKKFSVSMKQLENKIAIVDTDNYNKYIDFVEFIITRLFSYKDYLVINKTI